MAPRGQDPAQRGGRGEEAEDVVKAMEIVTKKMEWQSVWIGEM
jgi:hypothetical protein